MRGRWWGDRFRLRTEAGFRNWGSTPNPGTCLCHRPRQDLHTGGRASCRSGWHAISCPDMEFPMSWS